MKNKKLRLKQIEIRLKELDRIEKRLPLSKVQLDEKHALIREVLELTHPRFKDQ